MVSYLVHEAEDPKLRLVYDRRQNALKWILVTCFGYLGYKNARFGKVDAHIAVCAFAREALLSARVKVSGYFKLKRGMWWWKEEIPYQIPQDTKKVTLK